MKMEVTGNGSDSTFSGDRTYIFPTTFAQQRLWFLEQLQPEGTSYLVPWSLRVTGRLNVEALDRSLNEVVRRHEILRTTFSWKDGFPVQVVHESVTVPLRFLDLSSRSDAEAEAQRLALKEANTPLNLERGPLVRARLLQLAPEEHVLLLTVHHIIFDGWSRRILVSELSALYEAFGAGRPSPLSPPGLQYADYAVWQRKQFQGASLDKHLSYWRQQLAGAASSLDLPTDRPRPPVQTFNGARVPFAINKELTDKLKEISRAHGATLFMTLLAGFQALLSRYSNQDDVLVGTPIASRNRAELEELIGFFANTLVIRTRFSDDPSFRQLLAQVRETTLGAYEHQDLPFEKLVEELHPERNLSQNPLFQVLFTLQNQPRPDFELPGLKLRFMSVGEASAKFNISAFLSETPNGISGRIEYNTDLFDAATIEEMARHFRLLLEAATENPDTHIADLPLLSEAERQEILVVRNATQAEYPRNVCVHELMERQTERAPEATAIVMSHEAISYRELNERANQLAHYLMQHGAGPEVLIGIYLERSINMIVALLAVLKSGAAYVPLDPAYPAERIAFVVEDAGISLLLTQTELLHSLPASSAITIDMQTIAAELAREDRCVPQSPARPENLAYVLYTSGSTGKPKGVQITHANLVNFLISMQREPGLRASDSLLGVTTLSFDIAGLEIYLPLITGARLILASRSEASDGRALLDLMRRHHATVMQATPATWRMLLEAGWKGSPELRILCGGEALPGDLASQLLPRCAQLWNMYGPTETTIWSSVYRVQSAAATLPIGRPIANTTFYILDSRMRPLPMGVAGELFIGGEGVARGYLRRPELTAEKFLSDPFAERPGARLYRTGDIARYLRDGNVQYLGRSDFQVKIRGFRIELGEIESALSKHPSVQECVAVTRENGPGDTRLVAYAVPRPGFRIAAAELRTWVKQTLPSYMVPSVIVELDALPLTPNGKVDRKALPKPGATVSTATDFVPARDEIELALTRIWQEVLNVSTVGIRDNFFDLGGHSLLAVRLMAEIKEKIGRDIPLTALFQGATVEYLAEVIRGKAPVPTAVVHKIQPLGDRPPFFAAVVAGVNALGYVPLAKHLGTERPLYALQRSGPGPRALRRPLTQQEYEEIATEYIQAMRTVQPQGPYHLGGFCEGAQIAFEMTRQLELQGEQVRLLAIFDTWVVENTQNRRLWRLYYYTQRMRQLRRLPFGGILAAIGKAARNRIQWLLRMKSAPPKSEWRQIYWPAEDFVQKCVNTRITVFKVPQQPYYYRPDPFLGWGSRSLSGVDVQVVRDGRHRLLLREPHVRKLAEVLSQVLERYTPPPLVSVIIPAYRCAQYIAQALDSVLAQSYTNCEILVVNDGSPDKQPNRGPAAARNQGILESQGKYVAFLDADDYWGSNHLAKQMAQFQLDPSLELAYCDSVLIKGSMPLVRAFAIQPQGANVTFDSLLVEDCAIATSTTVVSREAIMRAGGFDENFLRCEDFEMWLRLAFAGTHMAYHPDADVFHRVSETSLSADRLSMKKDRIRVYQKVVESLPVSDEQRRVVHRLVADIETACDVDLLKHFLHRGEYPRAREAAQRANARGSGWKVRVAALGLRLTPGLFRQFFRARAWLLRIRKHHNAPTAGTLPSHADTP